jgi:hypothetical protein
VRSELAHAPYGLHLFSLRFAARAGSDTRNDPSASLTAAMGSLFGSMDTTVKPVTPIVFTQV